MSAVTTCPEELQEMVMIEYPGFVRNTDKALDTLGGLESIEKAVESQRDRLELRFRKSDPLAHPAFGDRVSKKCLVIRLRRRKTLPATTSDTAQQPQPTPEAQTKIEVLGKIQTSFRFDTLAEFQWLPMQRMNLSDCSTKGPNDICDTISIKRTPESINPQYASILDDALPLKNPFDNSLKGFNPDAPMLILPAVFSRFDTPREIHQAHPKFRSKEMRDEFERQQSLAIIGRTRKKRSTMSYLLNYGDPIPERPSEKLIKDRLTLSATDRDLVMRLERCFRRQPVWSKHALCFELNCTTGDIKYILPFVAYHYLTGPFRTMWVRYNYDPHKDKSSKILQTLDFRVKNPQNQKEYSKRSLHQYQLPMRKNADTRNKQQIDLKSMVCSASSSSSNTQQQQHLRHLADNPFDDLIEDPMLASRGINVTETMCKFRRDLVPTARQLSYLLKDIEIDEVQAIVHQNDGREPDECSERDGWLPEGTIDRIRKIMNKTLNDTFHSMANQLVKSTSDY